MMCTFYPQELRFQFSARYLNCNFNFRKQCLFPAESQQRSRNSLLILFVLIQRLQLLMTSQLRGPSYMEKILFNPVLFNLLPKHLHCMKLGAGFHVVVQLLRILLGVLIQRGLYCIARLTGTSIFNQFNLLMALTRREKVKTESCVVAA